MCDTALAKSIAIIGAGYVGIVTGATLAHLGHQVVCVDNDVDKIARLQSGELPIFEPGLAEVVNPLIASGALKFTTDLPGAVKNARVVFICVGTPMSPSGAADMCYVEAVARGIGAAMDGSYRVVVNKSTVPIGSGDWVAMVVQDGFADAHSEGETAPDFDVASNPEFLREGSAVADSFYPDRVVIGARSERALQEMRELYAPLLEGRFSVPGVEPPKDRPQPVPFVVTDLTSAETMKYAANAFLALKISYINEIARICEHVGADVSEVAKGIGYDRRIGHRFLSAGIGWGGSCFRKDVSALAHIARQYGQTPHIIEAAMAANDLSRQECVNKVMRELKMVYGKTIGLLGLAFKPDTDDLRDAPALTIAARLIDAGARVKAYDPVAMPGAARLNPDIRMAADPYDLAREADALVLVTEWPQFRTLDLDRLRAAMRTPVFVDGRNLYNASDMRARGFRYVGFGI
ncbi:MAG TPA: UDP-glucose/GDP-mannose dehydrogenase family protein [Armatimonadota bacterium]|jgi:UDPglucose 6-dehydrogenase